jgi:formylglycine-generating enzyme required for sulfatase activity
MRASVLGVAVLMAAGIAGVGALAWTTISRPSGKARGGAPAARAESEPARPRKPSGSRATRTVGLAEVPEAPWSADDDRDEPGGTDAPSDASHPGRDGPRTGAVGPGQPGSGVEPGAPAGPGAASPRAAPGGGFAPAPLEPGSACPARMADIGSFCIDTTEVTNVLYAAFLAAKPSAALQPAACAWNVDYTPSGGPPASDTRPVVGVSWCDAWLYCAWSGKRLCGHVGDGANNPTTAFADASMSEWYAVCTNGGATAFAYGDTYDGAKCQHADEDGGYVHASSIPSCVGTKPPYDTVFDMSGNAGEWEGSCSGDQGAADLCRVRGGGPPGSSEGSCAMDELQRRDQASRAVGFRCCAAHGPR